LPSLTTYNNCPSPEALNAYANDDLAKGEIRRIELHVLECPLCSEAIELYMQGDAQTIAEIDKNVSQYIDNQYDRKVIPIRKRVSTYSIAASLLLMFGAIYFLAKPKENNLANITQTPENQIIKQEDVTLVEPNAMGENSEMRKEKAVTSLEKSPVMAEDRAITETESPMPQMDRVLADEVITVPQTSAAKKDIEAVTLPQIKVEPSVAKEEKEITYTPNGHFPTASNDMMSKAKKNNIQPDLLRKGTAFYKTNNFAEAAKVFREILADEPNNQGALYYLGLSEQGRGFYQNAIDPFSKVESNNQNYSEAQYQLALSYLKINKLAKAKAILKVLSESENPRKTEAVELLKQL
jgi:TolA-binding protein